MQILRKQEKISLQNKSGLKKKTKRGKLLLVIFFVQARYNPLKQSRADYEKITLSCYLQERISLRAYFRAEASLSAIHLLNFLSKSSSRK